jgi:hypothetical protein
MKFPRPILQPAPILAGRQDLFGAGLVRSQLWLITLDGAAAPPD